jgi:hypothetical protein
MNLFEGYDPLLKTFWYVAIPSTLIFLFQTVSTFMGADAGDGLDADFDGDLTGHHSDAAQLFSLRNLINFLLGFSWTGISFYYIISSPAILITVALAAGVVFVLLFFFIIKQVQKLAEDNSFKPSDALQKSAEVYLAIPAQKSGKGKVLISIKGSFRELDAITENERIETGAVVRVLKADDNNLLTVERI